MAGRTRNKLYFDVNFTGGGTVSTVIARCTSALSTVGTPGYRLKQVLNDRYGGFMKALPTCDLNTPEEIRRRNSAGAWFQFENNGGFNSSNGAGIDYLLDFVYRVSGAPLMDKIPNPTAGGVDGTDPCYARQWGVRLQFNYNGTANRPIAGVLYVQRQHSIEV